MDDLGIIDYMLLFQQLLHSGYQNLRWFSYVAPTGLSFRCHITLQDNLYANRELLKFDEECVWSISVNREKADVCLMTCIENFSGMLSPALLDRGKGSDPEYVAWFDRIVKMAINGEGLPEFTKEYHLIPFGHILVGSILCPGPPMKMRIISWNIDGVRAHFESLKLMVERYLPDVICLQKYKDINASAGFELQGYNRFVSTAPYAGVSTYVKEYLPMEYINIDKKAHFKGHLIPLKFRYPAFTLFNVYTPFSNSAVEGAVGHRRMFDDALLKMVASTCDRSILCGDFNVVHSPLDCWDHKFKRNQANFYDWERENFDNLLNYCNLFDTYRRFNPTACDFTYFFRNDKEVRAKNQGHRIDYFLASDSLEPQIAKAEIIKDITASANNPILLDFRY